MLQLLRQGVTPEKLALDEAGLRDRAAKRLGQDPARVIEAFRTGHPEASSWDLWILIATDHPRGTYSRELAKRKAEQRAGKKKETAAGEAGEKSTAEQKPRAKKAAKKSKK